MSTDGRQHRPDSSERSDRSARMLARVLAGAAVAHFAVPGPFDKIVPSWLPGRARTWTEVSGAVELLLAAGIAAPRTRRASAYAAAGYFAAVFPANVKMAYDWRHRARPLKAAAYGRLPLQIPLVLWARQVARGAVS
ncbi:MAG TPA: hypothetical protein VGO89_04060 [Streptomyces sp.]|jgi:uncharacterized membrane protein|nr:hypothetical protein [Streptomyces sp.]